MAENKGPKYTVNAVSRVDGRDYWTRVGVAFENSSGEHPLSLVINPGVSVTGKLVLSVPKAKDETDAPAA
ncbi:MAG: hypothetical protein EBR40_06200 [Proteobacteria bacterium]|nr:hypothetical protein [Pseudomonadota bacterium]